MIVIKDKGMTAVLFGVPVCSACGKVAPVTEQTRCQKCIDFGCVAQFSVDGVDIALYDVNGKKGGYGPRPFGAQAGRDGATWPDVIKDLKMDAVDRKLAPYVKQALKNRRIDVGDANAGMQVRLSLTFLARCNDLRTHGAPDLAIKLGGLSNREIGIVATEMLRNNSLNSIVKTILLDILDDVFALTK